MMTLISLAIGVAFIYSLAALIFSIGTTFFWELVTLIDIMLLGHWIEMRSIRQASGALNELAKLMPDTAELILSDGEIKTVPVSSLNDGDLILVRPGANIPADGLIVEGESHVNEAMLTGESKPVGKKISDQVIAGTNNEDGSLRVKVTATGDKTALAGIMRLVEQAQESKSDTQILADKAAGWLFYIAIAVAVLTGVAWTIGVGFNVEVIARVATVLVIACPHALGLAVPLVVAITTAMGAKNGILVRDRLALEKARLINTVIFDKTGTLTKGEFGVVGIAAAAGKQENDVLALAAAIEGDSEHTIARGIREKAKEIREYWKKHRVQVKKIIGQIWGARLSFIIERFENVSAKIATKLEELKAAGKDTSQLEAWLSDFDQKINLAKEKRDKAREKYEAISNLADANQLFYQAHKFVKEANNYLREAHKKLVDIVREMKKMSTSATAE